MRYDRVKVYKDGDFYAYLKPRDIEDLRMIGEYRKRVCPTDNRTTETIFIWTPEHEKR